MNIRVTAALLAASVFPASIAVLPGEASAQTAGESVETILAAQIRAEGFVCDKPTGARRDAELSKPDNAVWVIECGNAVYRISRASDRRAKVEALR